MVSITLSIDEKSRQEMQNFSWINWSEVARNILLDRLKKQEELEKLRSLLKNSQLTEEDIIELSKKARKGRFRELKKTYLDDIGKN
jgi:hypothetical protein